jgi:hypothetical protein
MTGCQRESGAGGMSRESIVMSRETGAGEKIFNSPLLTPGSRLTTPG